MIRLVRLKEGSAERGMALASYILVGTHASLAVT
jgi:hypothetical protein